MSKTVNKLDRKALRSFGLTFAAVLAVLFGILVPLVRFGLSEPGSWPIWPWIASGVVLLWGVIHPGSLILIYRPWMAFARVAQWVNTRIIMLLLGKDAMHRRFDSTTDSYRVPADETETDHVEKPY